MSRHLKLLIVVAGLVTLACEKDDPTSPSDVDDLVAVSGNSQRGWPGDPLARDLVVKAVTSHGSAITGVEVVWTVVSGGGRVEPKSSLTGPNGRASATWTLGREQVDQVVLASVGPKLLVPFTGQAAVVGEWEHLA